MQLSLALSTSAESPLLLRSSRICRKSFTFLNSPPKSEINFLRSLIMESRIRSNSCCTFLDFFSNPCKSNLASAGMKSEMFGAAISSICSPANFLILEMNISPSSPWIVLPQSMLKTVFVIAMNTNCPKSKALPLFRYTSLTALSTSCFLST